MPSGCRAVDAPCGWRGTGRWGELCALGCGPLHHATCPLGRTFAAGTSINIGLSPQCRWMSVVPAGQGCSSGDWVVRHAGGRWRLGTHLHADERAR